MAYTSQTLGRSTDDLIVLALLGQVINWDADLTDFAVDGQEHVAWLFDQDAQTIVAALFDPQYWTEDGAKDWLAPQAALLARSPVPATVHYLRKVIELLREHVSAEEFTKIVAVARAHAGGKLKGKSKSVEGEPDADADAEQLTNDHWANAAEAIAIAHRELTRRSFAVGTAPSDTQPYMDESTGLIWKPILRAATVYDWQGEPITVTKEVLAALVASFGNCGIEHVDIPIGHNPERQGDTPELNTGFVRALELRDDGATLWAALEFTDDDIKAKVLSGTIANVSVWIIPSFQDLNQADKVWGWVLWHVALTNKPQMTNLAPFTIIQRPNRPSIRATLYQEKTMAFQKGDRVVAADGTSGVIDDIQNGTFYALVDSEGAVIGWFPEADLSADSGDSDGDLDEMSLARVARKLGLQAADLRGFAQQRTALQQEMELARTKARKTEIGSIIAALEGRATHDAVTPIDGTRHYPVVVAAVDKALRDQPAALKLTAGLDGTVPGLDAALLAVVNAIPKEARLSLKQPKVQTQHQESGVVTREEIKELEADVRNGRH